MKLALCVMFHQGEFGYLRLHLPVFAAKFDGIVAQTDELCTDGSVEYLHSLGAQVRVHEFHNHWGDFATALFVYAEELGYDAALRIDPDECMFSDAADHARRILENEATLLVLPRYEFVVDRLHVRADNWPDWQARGWRLRRGIVVQGQHHEGIDYLAHNLSPDSADPERRVCYTGKTALYHYGSVGAQHVLERDFHYLQVAREQQGLPPLAERPADRPFPTWPKVELFTSEQPLDPVIIGMYAPWSE